MAQARIQAAGRPGSALLILVGIFATAAILRLPIGAPPIEPLASVLNARGLTVWSEALTASMERPQIVAAQVETRHPAPAGVGVREPLAGTALTITSDVSRPEVSPTRPALRTETPAAPAQPALVSTVQTPLAGFAAPVVPVPFVEQPPSVPQPFSALGTAFAKTGGALALAFRKTGQGILAPF